MSNATTTTNRSTPQKRRKKKKKKWRRREEEGEEEEEVKNIPPELSLPMTAGTGHRLLWYGRRCVDRV
uniref:Uncharacterized protein n=1 Tax=Nelumbo nucifera TaxID=4432 RepID=A0A822ZJR7_NELNU|nr:TPA_asm: hypothetical protein HUJ06_003203 [Nelumbo nucifera]